jgi:hypothetical protein
MVDNFINNPQLLNAHLGNDLKSSYSEPQKLQKPETKNEEKKDDLNPILVQ